jgi:5'-nucleotidase
MEGTILGVPSIALSQSYSSGDRENVPWATAVTHAPDIIRKLLKAGVSPATLININFPNCEPDEIAGVTVCTQGKRDAALLKIEERRDGRNIPYYWIGFERQRSIPRPGTDLAALAERRIAVTPLRVDLTDTVAMTHFATAFE